jgi:GNAT superfamily N-acetyltransferase
MENSVKIRPATHKDSADIANLMAQLGYPCTPAEMGQRLDRLSLLESEQVFVAERAGQVLGVGSVHLISLLHESGNVGRITALVVRADVRGQGIGSRLVREAESWAWSHDCQRMEVTSGDHRPDAHRFYEACGFKYDARRFLKRKS